MENSAKNGLRIGRLIVMLVGAKVCLIAAFIAFLVVMTLLLFTGAPKGPAASELAGEIPPIVLEAYRTAADRCAGLEWPVLAGVGKVESHHGSLYGRTLDRTDTVQPPLFGPQLDGTNQTEFRPIGGWLGHWGLTGPFEQAMGPMQFIPPTWATYGVDQNGDGYTDPQNIHDATAAAADLLCDSGIAADPNRALRAYNNSQAYVDEVLHFAALYADGIVGGDPSKAAQRLAYHPNVTYREGARNDLLNGIVDPRLVNLLLRTAEHYTFDIGYFKSGHDRCVKNTGEPPNCTVSNHWYGRAADIGEVNGRPVNALNLHAKQMIEWWRSFPVEPPGNVGSPWDFGERSFTDSGHKGHVHVAYMGSAGASSPPPPTPTPLPRIPITQLFGPLAPPSR